MTIAQAKSMELPYRRVSLPIKFRYVFTPWEQKNFEIDIEIVKACFDYSIGIVICYAMYVYGFDLIKLSTFFLVISKKICWNASLKKMIHCQFALQPRINVYVGITIWIIPQINVSWHETYILTS